MSAEQQPASQPAAGAGAADPIAEAAAAGVEPMPEETPFIKRLGGAAFVFTAYFTMCWVLAASGLAQSAARASAPGIIVFLLCCFGFVSIAVDSGAAYPFRELAGKIPILGGGLYSEKKEWKPKADYGRGAWMWVPDWGLLACAMCTGMWAGTLLSAVGLNVFPVSGGTAHGVRDLFAHGLMGSAWCWIAHAVLSKLGAYED